MAFEKQFQQAIRDAVNRPSRKPFAWGGLAGYKQLSAIADGIRQLVDETPETHYLRRLLSQVERGLDTYRALAHDLAMAHDWLRRVAAVLQYPHPTDEAPADELTSAASPDTRPPQNSETWATTRFSSRLRAKRSC